MGRIHIGVDTIPRIVAADAAFTQYNAIRALRLEDGHVERRQIGGAIALRDPAHTNTYYNRVLAFGSAECEHLPEIAAFHNDIGKASILDLTPDCLTSDVIDLLRAHQYAFSGSTHIFAMACSPDHERVTGFSIRRARPDDIHSLAALWSQGEPFQDKELILAKRTAAQFVPEFPTYVTTVDGRTVAMASTFIHEDVAWLGNATTDTQYQGRGIQLAMLAHRIRDAAQMGCTLAVTDTGFDTISHRNVERAGFMFAYTALAFTGVTPVESA